MVAECVRNEITMNGFYKLLNNFILPFCDTTVKFNFQENAFLIKLAIIQQCHKLGANM